MQYQPVIGLEIHVQLKTKTKMFCPCANVPDGTPANTAVCSVCTGQPGALPVVNSTAIEFGIRAAAALGCTIQERSKFDRKNYFYPDLPKGYQISQYDMPIAKDGYLEIEIPKGPRNYARINIIRVHLEEDAAKSFHDEKDATLVDYNRGGTPLIEIVTAPDIATPFEAKIFLQELRTIMRYLGVSNADMERGELRCDANVSLRPADTQTLFPKTEIKNLNSFKAVERALEYEIMRQEKLWGQGKPPSQQSTRGWDEDAGETVEQRVKEAEQDYRYFPEPDIPPLDLGDMITRAKSALPELPAAKRKRFMDEYGFSGENARFLTSDLDWAEYAENTVSELKEWLASVPDLDGTSEEIYEKNKNKLAKLVGGWLCSKLAGAMADKNIDIKNLKITPENFAEFVSLIYANKVGSAAGQKILAAMLETGQDPSQIMEDRELGQMSDVAEIEQIVRQVVEDNPDKAEAYRAGKTALIQFFVGQVMIKSEGTADPNITKVLLEKFLQK
ncbi:MAG: Asp-tRNA(Asn)/Glu-tRNA(Gln) amidotransferase subunit GatB [Patescibacteria group bacterium]|nr:Asp-tRNA(Asn)/Glu-tRNA(Gln) amidotransferase subunit GatB [Patescibacteria group bacterium]